MPRLVMPVVAVLALCHPLPAQSPAATYRLEVADQQTVTAAITYEIRTEKFVVTRWMAFLPEPPSLPSQRIARVVADPAGMVVTEKSRLPRKVRFIDIKLANPKPGASLILKLEIEATLRSRKLVPLEAGELAPKVAPLPAAETKYYLSSTPQADHDSQGFREWFSRKGLQAKKGEAAPELAARVMEVLRSDFEYRFDPEEEKRASLVCLRKSCDCAGMTNLLVATMRANGVPARSLVGRFARPRQDGSKPSETGYDRPHVRAEIFLAGVGWVPVDPAEAHMSRRRPVSDFIGVDRGDLLVLHLEGDLVLPFPDKLRTADMLQISPYYWAFGKGSFDGTFGPTGWDLKAKPVKK